MSGRRVPVALVCCLLAVALAGCGVFRAHRPVTLQVIDGDTRQPLSAAEVKVSYLHMLDFGAPLPVSGVTDERGVVTLRVGEHYDTHVTAAHPSGIGWTQPELRIRSGFVETLPRKGSGRVDHILELWTDPAPVVEFVIPSGYRGPIKARFEQAQTEEFQPGTRRFPYQVSESGRVTVKAPKYVIEERGRTRFTARYKGGNLLPFDTDSKHDEIALRTVHYGYPDRPTRLFIIGTRAEADTLYERTIRRLAPNHIQSDRDAYNRVFDE